MAELANGATELKAINANATYVVEVGVYVARLNSMGNFVLDKSEVLDYFLVEPIRIDHYDIRKSIVGFKEIITGEQVVLRKYGYDVPYKFYDYDIQAITREKQTLLFGKILTYEYRNKIGDLYWDLRTANVAVKLLDESELVKYLEQSPDEIRSKIENLRNNAYNEYMNKKHYVKVRKK